MSNIAFQKCKRGMEEARAYMKGEREGYFVTVPFTASDDRQIADQTWRDTPSPPTLPQKS